MNVIANTADSDSRAIHSSRNSGQRRVHVMTDI
jgi:hypothetical protein